MGKGASPSPFAFDGTGDAVVGAHRGATAFSVKPVAPKCAPAQYGLRHRWGSNTHEQYRIVVNAGTGRHRIGEDTRRLGGLGGRGIQNGRASWRRRGGHNMKITEV